MLFLAVGGVFSPDLVPDEGGGAEDDGGSCRQ